MDQRYHEVDAAAAAGPKKGVPAKECTFCRIVRGDLAAQVVLADDAHLAFLDHRPLFPGHVVVVPRGHVETLPDLPAERVGPLFLAVQRVTKAVEQGMGADGVFNAINNRVSQSVPHLHVHVIPRRKKDGLKGFFWPRYGYSSEEEMVRVREAIASCLGQP
jgi:histidine triad (HIT) family protein